ncbi:MAG TPA: PRC-barrel domain-containing protein [Flavisolibacter sp.]|jgi:sporulation protein YlmC with PRC-barrel domain|nr:PRC-barrel domain-containing protein [Flavisolibacter sp.]
MESMKHRRLQELDRSDFEIVQGEPDIRGWDVRNSRGQKIGEVEELIVDAQQKKVRYMVVDLDDNELKLDHKKVLVPIGLAQLHEKDDDVILPNVQGEHFTSLPAYDKNSLTPEVERRICSTFGRNNDTLGTTNSDEHHPEFYKHDYFNDDNLYKHRLHEPEPVKKESEFEKGLRLWEKRSEGGIIPDNSSSRENYREREIEENARMEMVRNRRSTYEQRRGGIGRDNYRRHDNSIEGRIRDEGLRDA